MWQVLHFLIELEGAMWNQKSDDYNADTDTIYSLTSEFMITKNERDDQSAPYMYYNNAADLWICVIWAFILRFDACVVCIACQLDVHCSVQYIVLSCSVKWIVNTLSLSAVSTSLLRMCISSSHCSILLVQFIKQCMRDIQSSNLQLQKQEALWRTSVNTQAVWKSWSEETL